MIYLRFIKLQVSVNFNNMRKYLLIQLIIINHAVNNHRLLN